MNKIIVIVVVFLILSIFVSAHGEQTFIKAEEIIDAKISCEILTEDELEIIGDYYMEQMHPGEVHERMDEMMGGEGSYNLQQIHINLAKSFYCGEHDALNSGMIDTMGRSGMMGSRTSDKAYSNTGMSQNMMGGWVGLIWILIAALLFGLIFGWTYKITTKKK